MTIVTIDFEASCLPRHGRSFPIEVGITVAGRTRSWLIRPHESWAGWDWTAEAEAMHGLTFDQVMREGLPADAVLDRLVAGTEGRRVVADSLIDQYWLETLARAAGEITPLRIDHVSTLLDEYGAGNQRIGAAVAHADALYPVRHRAGSDSAWLWALIDDVAGNCPAFPAMSTAIRPAASMGAGNNL